MASKTYQPLTRGKLRAGDQVLYADFVQDCEAKRRWHRVAAEKFGRDVAAIRERLPFLKFRRAA